ncbi:hypothetical protein D3C71_1776450 [compost metagenome]
MRTELARVFAGNVILIGVVLEDHQVGDRADEAGLTNFLLEAQEKYDPIIT